MNTGGPLDEYAMLLNGVHPYINQLLTDNFKRDYLQYFSPPQGNLNIQLTISINP